MKRAFTLIEMLIVIVIIGTLAALLVPNFMNARERARDAQRKSDLKQIQKALEMYHQDQTTPDYPVSDFFFAHKGQCWSSGPSCTSNVYMNKIPQEPTNSKQYYFTNINSLEYNLCACLENSADPDAVTSCSACLSGCAAGPCYIVTQP